MIPKECKRIIEVDFPIAKVSMHSAREKSIRHGHPSTLHLWWARRPLAACRAVLLGLLLPDPCDQNCPKEFPGKAWKILNPISDSEPRDLLAVRKAILDFIADFSAWENSSKEEYLDKSRSLVKAVYGDDPPLVVDPFAGGGSIPLEALRLGCEAFASDLNPVACLILKVMLEDIPRHGPKLAEELQRVGAEIKKAAEKELAEFYPTDPDGAKPIAYLWARTVRCEAPNCGAEIPLMRSFWLCKKESRKRALRYKIIRADGKTPNVEFEVFEPKSEKEVPPGTVTRAKATCLCCPTVLPPERVRAQLAVQRGGADVIFDENGNHVDGARLLAVVLIKPGVQGRNYRLPNERDYQAILKAQKRLKAILDEWERGGRKGICPVPDELIHAADTRNFWVCKYGPKSFGDLFTARQKVALVTLVAQASSLQQKEEAGKIPALRDAVRTVMALLIGKGGDGNSCLSRWMAGYENPVNCFSRQALPMVWDFCESGLASQSRGVFLSSAGDAEEVIKASCSVGSGQVQTADAVEHPLPGETVTVWFTDPPYYDAIPYADLSDFFFVWLKRTLPDHPLLRDPFDSNNPLTPKAAEAVQNERSFSTKGKPKDREFYEQAMAHAFAEGRRVLREDGVGAVVFAHKTTEGWEALLSGMIRGGWTITGSWPIATEMSTRLRARESAALATSVHLVCRPRPDAAEVGDWNDVLRELPRRISDWIERLQAESVRGADLVFACIGPALEIYSRYSKVVDAQDREIPLGGDPEAKEPYKRGFLSYVWEIVGRAALEQVLGTAAARARNGAVGAIEEDARLTALFLWTLQSTNGNLEAGAENEERGKGEEIDESEDNDETIPSKKTKGYSLVFDIVRRFAQPLGIHLPDWEGRIIETKKGAVRLLPVGERAEQLFGEEGASAVAKNIEERASGPIQLTLFMDSVKGTAPEIKGRRKKHKELREEISEDTLRERHTATTLDRVHAAMLLQAGGQTNALRALIASEQERGPDFLRLANALSALYPKVSEEKRLLDAMLLVVPRY